MSATEQSIAAGSMEEPVSVHHIQKEETTSIERADDSKEQTQACINNIDDTNNPINNIVMKGKRTKRPRPADHEYYPPVSPVNNNYYFQTTPTKMVDIDSSSPESDVSNNNINNNSSSPEKGYMMSTTTTTITTTTTTTTQEEEEDQDMANCLILLAQGDPIINVDARPDHNNQLQMFTMPTTLMPATQRYGLIEPRPPNYKANNNRSVINGGYGYECKTCYKTFASFQALGGHRASCHKKPRKEQQQGSTVMVLTDKDDHDFVPGTTTDRNGHIQFGNYYSNAGARSCKSRFMRKNHNNNNNNNNNSRSSNSSFSSSSDSLSLQLVNTNVEPYNTTGTGSNSNITKSPRVHECAVCGAVFASGQALGGHMRRHRGAPPNSSRNMTNNGQHYHHNGHGHYQKHAAHDQIVLSLTRPDNVNDIDVVHNDKASVDVNLSLGLDLNLPASSENHRDRVPELIKDHHPQSEQSPSNQLVLSLMPPNPIL